jgi:hypothetical protein
VKIPVQSDLELFLTSWYRPLLAASEQGVLHGFEVGSQEPEDDPFPAKLLVIRDDSGPGDYFTAERALGLSVLMDNPARQSDAKRALSLILGLLWTSPAANAGETPRNPIVSVETVNGPWAVSESQDRARQYGTATVIVTPEYL